MSSMEDERVYRVVVAEDSFLIREGLRSALVPQFPHLSLAIILGGLLLFNGIFVTIGLRQFRRKAVL